MLCGQMLLGIPFEQSTDVCAQAHHSTGVHVCAVRSWPVLPSSGGGTAELTWSGWFVEQNPWSKGPLHSLCWVLLLILRSLLVLGEKFLFFWNLAMLSYHPLRDERKHMIPCLLVGSFR